MSSKRQQIIDAAVTLISAITQGGTVVVNGSTHTYSATPGTVDEWRITSLGDNELPAIAVRDEDAEIEGSAEVGRLEHNMAVSVSIADAGDSSLDSVRALQLDIVQAFGEDPTLGGLVHRLRFSGHGMDSEHSSERLTVATIVFNVLYRTQPFEL